MADRFPDVASPGITDAVVSAEPEVPTLDLARGSSFYSGMRILPPERRQAMYAIYAFCRAVDDIADGDAPGVDPHYGLQCWRDAIDRLYAGERPALTGILADPVARFGLRREDFLAVIDGMAMDAERAIQAPGWDELDLYCDRVASAVGRLSVRVFGMDPDGGDTLSHHLGRALQLTNILRDLAEDADRGRLYLPREALLAAGIEVTDPPAVIDNPRLPAACAPLAARAAEHFAAADAIMARYPAAVVKAPALMGAMYKTILERLVATGFAFPGRRVELGLVTKLAIVARTLLGLARRPAPGPGSAAP